MADIATDNNWIHNFHAQGSLLLRSIPEYNQQTVVDRTVADIANCSQSLEDCDVCSARCVNVKSCLMLMKQILNRAVFALTLHQFRVETVLLRSTHTDVSNASVTLDSLLSSTDEKTTQSSSDLHSSTLPQSFTTSGSDVDNVCVFFKAEQIDMLTEETLKQKPLPTKRSDRNNCSDLKKNRSCENGPACNDDTCWSSTMSSLSEEFSRQTASCLTSDDVDLPNGQLQHGVTRYGLRKRKFCQSDLQADVVQSGGEEKGIDRLNIKEETVDDHGGLTDVKMRRSSTLTTARCLVMKRPVCCLCGLSFPSKTDCITHWRQDHIITGSGTKPHLACQQCPMRFGVPASRVDSRLHLEIQMARWLSHAVHMHNFPIPSDVEKFTCTEPGCDFVALTPASYQTHHLKNQHGTATGCVGASALVYFKLCCFLCPAAEGEREVFSSKPALREHVLTKHAHTDQLRQVLLCPVCQSECPINQRGVKSRCSLRRRFFHVVYRLLHHLVSKHGWSVPEFIHSFPCEFPGCRYVAVARSDVESHSISHDAGDGSRNPCLPCEKCGKLVKFRALRSHLQLCQVSLDDRRTQECPYCSVRLSSKYSLCHHIQATHTKTSKPFLCSYCTYSCRLKSNLEEHIFHRHGSNVSRRSVVTCLLCPFKTIRQGALRRHISSVHSDLKTFRCSVCDKLFKCQSHLKSHMVAHEERQFACQSCGYRAARKANLQSHVLAQHGTNRKCYRCTEPCQYSTGYPANLRKHQKLFCKYRQPSVDPAGTTTDQAD